MTTTFTSPVTNLLNAQSVPFTVIEIPLSEDKKPVRNLEELLEGQGLDPKSVVRSVLFRTGSDQFILLAVAGGGRADWAILRNHLNERKLRMAEYDEVPEATGYVVGAVPPVALPEGLKVLVDNSVKDYETVVIGSGVLGYALALKGADLLKMLDDAEQGSFAKA
ncbi:aminoacyl-tRNA deacylase [Methylobacillus sp. Pita2]|uniref:aminoacyl-tRNA deacylase n=1 Tax=Methylobacillus sp. Pita2 TaxID=3383245 RepID=UPI0038B5E315